MGRAGVAAISRGHVAVANATEQMASDSLTPVEQLDRALGDARFDPLAQQAAAPS